MRSYGRKLGYILISIACLLAVFVGIQRIKTEDEYNKVQIAIDYSDVLTLARNTNRSLEDVLKSYKDLGANVLFVRENLLLGTSKDDLSDFKSQGQTYVVEGYELKQDYPNNDEIILQYNYIETYDEAVRDQIFYNLGVKGFNVKKLTIDGRDFIELAADLREISTIGVGYNYNDLSVASELGYVISPQVKGWDQVTDESIAFVIHQLEAIPNLGVVYFGSSKIPGASHEMLQDFVAKQGLGYVEFFSNKQEGFKQLYGEDVNVVRLHTLTDAEVEKYTQGEKLDRYMLALKERNLRSFLFKLPHRLGTNDNEVYLMDAITSFKKEAEKEGYVVTTELGTLPMQFTGILIPLLIGLATILVFVDYMYLSELKKIGLIAGGLGFLGFAGLLVLKASVAIKLMSLFTAIIFPAYAVLRYTKEDSQSLKQTFFSFIKISCISLVGGLFIVALLSRNSYMLGVDGFTGIKLAHLAPIVLIVCSIEYKRRKLDINYYKGLLDQNINYWILGLALVAGAVLVVYTSRTGNTGEISEVEAIIRQLLNDILGVRPRTKEFLIGHPIMLVTLYYGCKKNYLPLIVLGLMGQISIVNTYAHLHTPLIISLMRSVNGMLIGVVVGVILIKVSESIFRRIGVWQTKNQ